MTQLGYKCDSNDSNLTGWRDSMRKCYDMYRGGRKGGDADEG